MAHKYTAECVHCKQRLEADKLKNEFRLVWHTCKRTSWRGTAAPGSELRIKTTRKVPVNAFPIFIVLSSQANAFFQAEEKTRRKRFPYYEKRHPTIIVNWSQWLDPVKVLQTEDARPDSAKTIKIWSRPWRYEEGQVKGDACWRHVYRYSLRPLEYMALMELADDHEVRHKTPGALVSNYLEGVSLDYLRQP